MFRAPKSQQDGQLWRAAKRNFLPPFRCDRIRRRGDTLGGAARSRLVLTPASAVKPGFPGRPTSPRFVVEAEAAMKWLKWIAIAIVVTVGVLLFLNKDDLRRTMQMRQMLWS